MLRIRSDRQTVVAAKSNTSCADGAERTTSPRSKVWGRTRSSFMLSPMLVFYEMTQACDLVCQHCRACAEHRPARRSWRRPLWHQSLTQPNMIKTTEAPHYRRYVIQHQLERRGEVGMEIPIRLWRQPSPRLRGNGESVRPGTRLLLSTCRVIAYSLEASLFA